MSQKSVCTTIRVEEGVPLYWAGHRQRLCNFAEMIGCQLAIDELEKQVQVQSLSLHTGVLRVELHPSGEIAFTTRPLPVTDLLSSIKVRQVPIGDPRLKWVDRTSWDRLKRQQNVDILVFISEQNTYLECCIGNLFIFRRTSGCWHTPPLTEPILAGVMRSVILSNALKMGIDILEETITPQEDDELWMSNAVRGLVRLSNHGVEHPYLVQWVLDEV